MAEWSDYGNYENLKEMVNKSPDPFFDGLIAALNEREDFLSVRFPYLPQDPFPAGRPWINDDVFRGLRGDAIQFIRAWISNLCRAFVNYRKLNYTFSGIALEDGLNVDSRFYGWNISELLERVKDRYPYYRNKYPALDQWPHSKSTAEHVQLLYYMVNELKTTIVDGSFGLPANWVARTNYSLVKGSSKWFATWAEAKQALLSRSWERAQAGTQLDWGSSYTLDGWYLPALGYGTRACAIMGHIFRNMPEGGAWVDTYVEPSRQDFRWRDIPKQGWVWPGPLEVVQLFPMRTDVKCDLNNLEFDQIEREGFEVFVPEPWRSGSFPPNPMQVGNQYLWGATGGHLCVGTIFFDFRNYAGKD